MKYITLLTAALLAACSAPAPDAGFVGWNELYSTYDVEYIDDCLYYDDLVCEFE